MAELRELQRKLDSIGALQDVVHAMRSLAAVYVRRAEATLEATRPYGQAVNTALRLVMEKAGLGIDREGAERPALGIVFASDQGLAGSFNDRVAEAAQRFPSEHGAPVRLVCIGHRGGAVLALRGLEPMLVLNAPTSLEGIKAEMPDLAARVFGAFQESGAEEIHFVYNAFESVGHSAARVRRVLPPVHEALEPGRAFRYEPILTAPPLELLDHLVEEYLFIELYQALLESHASENGARLTAMSAASSNVEDRLEEIRRQYQSVRQDTITSELMDVVSGAEALQDDGGLR
ncbi:MAG: hypothetical protein GXY85_03475 [Candidatus Brocadiaceae bacterium]|nr:hypothetical protein [Candidatus Brocadiaceae bacterium]